MRLVVKDMVNGKKYKIVRSEADKKRWRELKEKINKLKIEYNGN